MMMMLINIMADLGEFTVTCGGFAPVTQRLTLARSWIS
jgi:hypothetical protein